MNMQNLLHAGLFLQVLTIGRLTSIIVVVIGLISIVIGRQAMARTARRNPSGRPRAIFALVLGVAGMAFSMLHLAFFTGGFGTGSGRAGSIVSLLAGLIGALLGGLALVRSGQLAGPGSDRR
jgi:hypothetical protein